jgi:hypothetical protein
MTVHRPDIAASISPALEAELLAVLRKAAGTTADIRAAMPELRTVLRSHYCGPLYCA